MKRSRYVPAPPRALVDDPEWYRDAVIYEIRTRSFADSNGDGVGDLNGMTEKLPYLEDLGVNALWLLPICPSPGKDDGYDISDYTDIHPDIGTLDDFRRFLDEAHRRGIRVITELVVNHTSDQHAWFQRARRAPPGSRERDFYVWSESPDRYRDARIIFKDFEHSNWSYDHVAKAYYWHRFFAHQPDLNYDSPDVQQAVFDVCDFWFGLGVDGLRLDAVPYLYEEDGTNCENLPQTHEFLKKLRRHVDGKWKNRMLLAEANQWPEDAAAYFGQGDECHMNFHFPIMPRIFMSIHMEDRLPVIDILEQTPALPPTAQWALFLRNHDELTLEMVTDEERDYMYRAYAHEPTARINLGIRRRLAPLLGNDRRKIELMNGLLLALPGTPVLYYGDEIGMGDNIYLGDRNGVRTPMQWSADRNAGFSRANPQKLILPVIIDPEYHFESLNVEAQQGNPNSLLWWTKRILALRRRYHAFGRGSIEFLSPENPRVLAFVRAYQDEQMLVVANLSRHVQYVELDLAKFRGLVPTEMMGGTEFPPINERPYLLSLPGHGFYWFSLTKAERPTDAARGQAWEPPLIRSRSLQALKAEGRRELERVLPNYLEGRRWYAGHGRDLASCRVIESVPVGEGEAAIRIVLVRTQYTHGVGDTYAIPVAFARGAAAESVRREHPHSLIARLRFGDEDGVLYDAIDVPSCAAVLVEAMRGGLREAASDGTLLCEATAAIPPTSELEARLPRVEHRFAGAVFGDRYVLKFFRRLAEGTSPELEILRPCLNRPEGPVPRLAGAIEFRPRRAEPLTIAVLEEFVPHATNGETLVREELGRFFDRVVTDRRGEQPPPMPARSAWALTAHEPQPSVRSAIGPFLESAHLLGRRIADLHLALGAIDQPAFTPEPYSQFDQRSAYQTNRNLAGNVLRILRTRLPQLDPAAAELGRQLLSRERDLYRRFESLRDRRITALRQRYHGDMRLRKALATGRDFVFVGFEGDVDRPLPERRRKRSPMRDLAGMLLSFEEMAWRTLSDDAVVRPGDRDLVEPWTRVWIGWCGAALVRGYREAAKDARFLPREEAEAAVLVDRFLFEKMLKTVGTRLAGGPAKVDRLLRSLVEMLEFDPARV